MTPPQPEPRLRSLGLDRGFWLLLAGAGLLILVGLIAIPLLARRPVALAPAGTPEGTVQRFYQAVYGGDYQGAYETLSTTTRRQLSLAAFQQQVSGQPKNSQVVVVRTIMHDRTATVTVAVTYTRPDGLFGSGQSTNNVDVLLQQEGSDWKVTTGPFYLPSNP